VTDGSLDNATGDDPLAGEEAELGVLQNGDVRYYQVSATPLAFAPGYEGTLLVFRDVTASVEREQDLDILKQVLTRVLRHNLRNDVTAIHGFAQSIADNAADGTSEKAERIVRLTEKLTATSETARRMEDVIEADGPERVDLRVADDGPGVPEYELETLAQGEETALIHGSGAGLWLIQTAVEDSNGDVRFDSGPDGTTVRLRLPAARE